MKPMSEPTPEQQNPPQQEEKQNISDPFGKGKKALIVEDDPTTTELLRKLLVERLFEVWQAKDGKDAWDKIRDENLPSIILSDFMMPNMDGFKFFKGLRENEKTKNIPVVFFSARKNIADAVLVSGADAFFPKPLDTNAMLLEVKKLISRKPPAAGAPAGESAPAAKKSDAPVE